MKFSGVITIERTDVHVKGQVNSQKFKEVKTHFAPIGTLPDYNSNSNSQDNEIMYKTWSGIEEVPYCFSRSSVKF